MFETGWSKWRNIGYFVERTWAKKVNSIKFKEKTQNGSESSMEKWRNLEALISKPEKRSKSGESSFPFGTYKKGNF